MKIDFTCPAELLSIEFAYDKCSFYLNNLDEALIVGAELKLSSYDEDDILVYQQTIKYHEIKSNYHEPLKLDFEIDDSEPFDYRELSIEKLWIEGNKTWRAGTANEFTYDLNALPDGRSLSSLQKVAGHDAVCYPEKQGDIWVCVCGRANRIDEDICRRCDRAKTEVFDNYNKDSVNEITDKIKAHNKEEDRQVLQEAAAMKDRQELIAERVKKRKKHRINIAVSAVLLFVVFFLLWYFGLPEYKSIAIDKRIEQGDYAWAKTALNTLPDRYDISARMLKVDYNIAKNDMNDNTEEALIRAISEFKAIKDYEDSEELILESKYRLAELYYKDKNYEKALDIFNEIEDYSDSGLKITEIRYNIAVNNMTAGELDAAYEILSSLQNYSDTENLLLQIDYERGKKAYDAGDMEKAIVLFSASDGYSDSEEWFYRALYNLAEQEFDAKNFEKAGEYYLEVANNPKASLEFKDAKTKANTCLYQIGKQALDNGEYEMAANKLEGILDYVNSKQLYSEAIRAIALKDIEKGDFDEALIQLGSIEKDEEVAKLISKAKYEKAKSLEESDIDAAINLYKDIQNYNDAGEIYQSLRYKQAEQMLLDGKFDEAALAFAEIGEYSDSQDRRKDSLYQKAKKYYSDDKLLEAKDLFLSLEGYSDSGALAKEIVLKLAHSYIDNKDYEKSVAMLESIELSSETESLIFEAKYLVANAFINDNNFEEALKYLEQIPDFRDSESLLEEVKYKVASEYDSKGKADEAAKLFAELANYKDSSERANRAFDETLENPAMLARQAYSEKKYADVLEALKDIDINLLPEKYADLKEIYQKSAYDFANKAYADKDIAKALKLYRKIPDYNDVEKKLKLSSFRIIGKWISEDGEKELVFNEDGSCIIEGTSYKHFFVQYYKLYVGNEISAMERLYGISKWDDKGFNAKDNNSSKHVYTRFLRVENDFNNDETIVMPIESTSTPTEALETPAPTVPVPIKLD